METTKHTPTPWKWNKNGRFHIIVGVATVYGDNNQQRDANCSLIVEAVNSFDSLRAALKALADDAHAMLNVLPACTGNAAAMAHVLSASIDKARAALGGE